MMTCIWKKKKQQLQLQRLRQQRERNRSQDSYLQANNQMTNGWVIDQKNLVNQMSLINW
jgi:hypothetical protein